MHTKRVLAMSCKALIFLLFIILTWAVSTSSAFAEENTTISVLIDGEIQQYEQPPLIDKGHTLVPLRAIFEALGAEIEWNSATKTATATKDDKIITISIGQKTAYVNNQPQLLDVNAQIINGHTMVPLRFISQSFGAYVNWRPTTKTVAIKTKRITPETTKLGMPPKVIESGVMEAIQQPQGIPQEEKAAVLKLPATLPIISPVYVVPLSDLNRQWKSFDTRHFRLYYYEQEEEIIIQSQFYDEIYDNLSEEFGHPLPDQIPIYYYNAADYLSDSTIPSWSIAIWIIESQSMKIMLDTVPVNEQDLTSFRHELTHAATLSSIDSSLAGVPAWFFEGAATYFEQAKPYYDLGRTGTVYKAFLDNKLIPFEDIAADSRSWPEDDVQLIYAEAQSFYGYLIDQYGETNVNEIYYSGRSFETVLQQLTNQTLTQLETNWRSSLASSYQNAIRVSGRIYYAEGAWYEGDIINGLQNGRGKYFNNNKLAYSGEFKEGEFDGQGILFYENGTVYQGQMKAGHPEGSGKYYWLEGDRYEGDFRNGAFEGRGTYYWKNGDIYEGEWKAGKQDGQGVVRNADGTSYSGLFREGEMV